MFALILKRMRESVRHGQFVMTTHADEEADADDFTVFDVESALGERRFVTFGISSQDRLLVVAHTEEDDKIHIISARLARRQERRMYEEG